MPDRRHRSGAGPTGAAGRGLAVVAIVVGTLLLAGGCALGSGPANAVPTPVAAMPPAPPTSVPSTPHLTGEEMSIEFDPTSQRALESTQTEWRTESPTLGQRPGRSDGRPTVYLPITDGTVDLTATPPRGSVDTAGSPMLVRSGTSVTFSDLVVDLDGNRITGTVDGRPTTVFDLDLSRAHLDTTPSLPPSIVGVSGHLSTDALREVTDRLGPGLTTDTTRVDIEMRLTTS